MKKLLPLAALLLLSFNLFAEGNLNTCSGIVTDYNEDPIEGIEVLFTNGLQVISTALTDATGYFSTSFYGSNVKAYFHQPTVDGSPPRYVPAVYHEDYVFQMDQIEDTKYEIITMADPVGSNGEMEIKLRRNFISGRVTNQWDGLAAVGIQVDIYSDDNQLKTTVYTDTEGKYDSGALETDPVDSDRHGLPGEVYANVKVVFRDPSDLRLPLYIPEDVLIYPDGLEGGLSHELAMDMTRSFIRGEELSPPLIRNAVSGEVWHTINNSQYGIPGIKVLAQSAASSGPFNVAPVAVAYTQQDGSFEVLLQSIPGGTGTPPDVKLLFEDPNDVYLAEGYDDVGVFGKTEEEIWNLSSDVKRGSEFFSYGDDVYAELIAAPPAVSGYVSGLTTNNSALEGIEVEIYNGAGSNLQTTVFTDQEGKYEVPFSSIERGVEAVKVYFSDPDLEYIPLGYGNPSINQIGVDKAGLLAGAGIVAVFSENINAQLTKNAISGSVSNSNVGLGGIQVIAKPASDDGPFTVEPFETTFTQSDGTFELTALDIPNGSFEPMKIYFQDPEGRYISKAYGNSGEEVTEQEAWDNATIVERGFINVDLALEGNTSLTLEPQQEICESEPAMLSGTIPWKTTYIEWSGGAGTFAPDNSTLEAVYTPTPEEEAAGSVTLTLAAYEVQSSSTLGTHAQTTITISPTLNWYLDADGDGYGDPDHVIADCNQPGGYVVNNGDSDDTDPDINTGGVEVCDGIDNDGDGEVDEGVTTIYYQDFDDDGYGDPAVFVEACEAPEGYVANNLDWDDTNPNVYPGALEICDGVDNDGDGDVDEGVTTIYYQDFDGDGYGNPAVFVEACEAPADYVTNSLDWDDTNPSVYPGAPEICDGKDNDGDGDVDEGVTTTYYRDADGDGYGDPAVFVEACEAPAYYVTNSLDWDDTNPNVYPGALEICDGVDNDGDGEVDEGVTTTYYRDFDDDGYGNPAVFVEACEAPAYYVTNNLDLDDTNPNVYPGAPELCDGIDNDGDEVVDEEAISITSVEVVQDIIPIGNAVALTINFSVDDGTNLTVDWGDGSSITEIIPGGSYTVSHSYASTGVYSLAITAGNGWCVSSLSYDYIVVYNPAAGFVTGGGWIDSPPGASIQYPDASGKAYFGFVAKYKKGQTIPTGNTEFQFKAGFLNFKSSAYEWLLVAGEKAKFKGEGTINGAGSYGFLISASDGNRKGDPDALRIKIWDVYSEAVVYDNQMDSFEEDPMTNISGGSIVVHTPKTKSTSLVDDPIEEENSDLMSLSVYPNPASEKLTVHIHNSNASDLTYSMIDITGKVIMNGRYLDLENKQIDVSAINPGMYFLIAQDKLNKMVEKVVIQ